MNTRRKGNKARLLVMRSYERQGYIVSIVERTGKFVKDKDCFGLFDIIALHPMLGYSFVQITTTKPHAHAAFTDFAQKYELVNAHVEVVQYVRQKKYLFDMYRYKPTQTITTKGVTLN